MRHFHILFLGFALLGGCGDEPTTSGSLDLTSSDVTPVDPNAQDAATAVDASPGSNTQCTQICDYTGCREHCEVIPDPVTPVTDPYAD